MITPSETQVALGDTVDITFTIGNIGPLPIQDRPDFVRGGTQVTFTVKVENLGSIADQIDPTDDETVTLMINATVKDGG
jgi:hypothetical protein